MTAAGNLFAATPAADSRIQNQAELSYFNPNLDRRETVLSDIVVLQVRAVPRFTLTGSAEQTIAAGDVVTFTHVLTNTGNVEDQYRLQLNNQAGDDFDFASLQIFIDVNNNGVIDSEDRRVTTVTLEPSESATLLVRAVTPNNASDGEAGRLQITANPSNVDNGNNSPQAQTDQAVIQSENGLSISKQASPNEVRTGESISYQITVNLPANSDGIEIQLDGQTQTAVVLRDDIPLNTQFQSTGDAAVVFHQLGAAQHDYQTSAPPNEQIDAVAVLISPSANEQQIGLNFTVQLNANASADIENTALLYTADEAGGRQSNTTTTQLANPATATLAFYPNNEFEQSTNRTGLGDPLFIKVNAAGCNRDASLREQYNLQLSSSNTGDQEIVTVVETTANSGIFQVADFPTRDANRNGVVPNNGMLETLANDQLQANLECAGLAVSANVLVDPFGVVFDSRSNQPVAGATVTLIDVTGENNGGNPGGPARVFADDGSSPAPSTVVTGPDGRFQFPLVAAGTYRLEIIPPAGYEFPSELAADELPGNRVILTPGSYGGEFEVVDTIVQLDVPLDAPVGSLFVTVTASPNELEYGQSSEICVTVINFTGLALTDTTVNLDLPEGYLIDGFSSPVVVGDLAIGERQEICYTLTAGPNAITSGTITAIASGFDGVNTVLSNTARTALKLKRDQFYGTIIGRVFVDCDENRIQENEEPGIPQVRVVLNNGQWAITDSEGMYSFAGLPPQTYVLRIDELTLPAHAELEVLDTRNGGDPRSRWVDLRQYDLHKANFADGSCSDELLAEVAARRQAISVHGTRNSGQLWQSLDRRLQLQSTQQQNRQSLPAASNGTAVIPQTVNEPDPILPATDESNNSQPEAVVDNQLAFVNVQDGMVWHQSQMTVQVKGRLGATLQIKINEEIIPQSSVGQRLEDSQKKLAVWDYIAVDFQPGENHLQLTALDSFGNLRGEVVATIAVAGKPTQLAFKLPSKPPIADGETPVKIQLELQDEAGLRVAHSSPVTLGLFIPQPGRVNSRLQWLAEDLDASTPGIQIMLQDGRADLQLSASVEPAQVELQAQLGTLLVKQPLVFKPYLQPFMLIGLLEGGGNRQDNGGGQHSSDFDMAETPEAWSEQRGDSRFFGRASLYARGAIGAETLLTARYESEDQQDELFNDIDPDRFYPVYGDAAIRGFAARSTSHTYLRLDRGQSWALYGDYTTQTPALANSHFTQHMQTDLGRFNRAVTGLQSSLLLNQQADYQTQLDWFAAEADSQQRVDELPALGISGPYQLSRLPLANSEQITILVRDREQPALIIEERSLQRFTDYILNADTGELLLRQPLASVTGADLHPQSIQISYEIKASINDAMLAGLRLQQNLGKVQVGLSSVRDEAELAPYKLHSIQAKWQLSEHISVSAEQARSEGAEVDTGNASRAEVIAQYERLRARLSVYQTDRGFANPSASARRGRTEWRLDASLRLSQRLTANVQLLDSEDDFNDAHLTGVAATLLWNLSDQLQLTAGIRHSDDSRQDDDFWTAKLRARLNLPVAQRNLGVGLGIEVDPEETERRLIDVNVDYAVTDNTRLYARHEIASTLNSRFSLDDETERDTTTVGVESSAIAIGLGASNSRLFSEYRARNAFDGRATEAAIGLRNRWQFSSAWRLDFSLENIRGLDGDTTTVDNFAVTTGVQYSPSERFKTTARLEYRDANDNERWLSSIGLAWKLDRSWSLLAKTLWNKQSGNSSDRDERRAQLGAAWRNPDDDRWNSLFKYEYRQRDNANRLTQHRLRGNLHWQPSGNWQFSHYAITQFSSVDSESNQMVLQTGLRSRYQFAEHWDIAALTALNADDDDRYRAAVGLELGWLVVANLWLNVGYNFTGFDDQVDSDEQTAKGSYFRLRFKFDEQTFGLGPQSEVIQYEK